MRIALVSCSSRKAEAPQVAKDLYTSPLFRLSRKVAERHADRWYILSAKYGLVAPNLLLAPYDETLAGQPRAMREAWAAIVQKQLSYTTLEGDHLIVLAGKAYDFGEIPGRTSVWPLQGLRIGERLRMLKEILDGKATTL